MATKQTKAQLLERLAELEAALLDAETQRKRAEGIEAKSWTEAYGIFDTLDGKNKPARYLFTDGQVMGRILAKHPQDGAIDTEKLQAKMVKAKLWELVSVEVPATRVLDEDMLTKAAKKNAKVATILAQCTITKEKVLRKRWGKGTKEELAELEGNSIVVLQQPGSAGLKKTARKKAVA